jgi:hypothetical protein
MTIGVEGAMQGRCANHVESVAVGTCERCGSYYCASCYKQLGAKRICSACLAIPGIDYLADARNKAWGKRDGWVWYLGGLGTLSAVIVVVVAISGADYVQAGVTAAIGAVLGCYFAMQPWARKAIFAIVPLGAFSALLGLPALATANQEAYYVGAAVGRGGMLLAFLIAAYNSTRNKLAFEIDVSDEELAKYYDKYLANPAAQRALAYGVLSLLIPLFIPVALVAAVRSLRKIDAKAWPPVTGRSTTIVGLVAAGASVLIWTAVVIGLLSH